jgi:hypothetical protein
MFAWSLPPDGSLVDTARRQLSLVATKGRQETLDLTAYHK